MTYRELYEKAERKLEKGEITSGEFDEMTKPLDEEIRPHGEWINGREVYREMLGDKTLHIEYDHFSCSRCHYAYEHKFNFCPKCGAEMMTKNVRPWDTSSRGVSGTVENSITQKEGEAK